MENVSPVIWIWAGTTILLAAAIGFVAGLSYAKFHERRVLHRTRSNFSELFNSVLRALETARGACYILEHFSGSFLTAEQLERLDQGRRNLMDQVTRIIDRQRPPAESGAEAGPPSRPELPQIKWLVTPEDRTSGLPDRTAFESNLEMLLEWARRTQHTSGLLLVKVDKFDGLKERYGLVDAAKLLKRFALVLCRSTRDTDLVCQSSVDTFGILLPATEAAAGEKLAAAMRDVIRGYHFRSDDGGPEVLVTASLGYTVCGPDDNMDFALNRAAEALSRSQRLGRNQLHVHDGQSLLHCLVN
jgi:diguanylate cyclase (GGDEF)-like protein